MFLPKIRFLTSEYNKSVVSAVGDQAPYTDLIDGRIPDIHWIVKHMDVGPDAHILEFGAWPTDNWRIVHNKWKNIMVTDSFEWFEGRTTPYPRTRDEWAVPLDAAEVWHGKLDVQSMEYEDAFDAIYSVSVLEHVIDDDLALQNIFRALKPGGLFIFTAEVNPYVGMQYDKDICFRVYDTSTLVSKVRDAGFTINDEIEDYSDFDEEFRAAINNPNLLRIPYANFASTALLARRP